MPAGTHGKKLRAAVEKLEVARQLKSADATFYLAEMNFYGNWSHPRDYPTAFERYRELADYHGEHEAQNMVGFLYATGFGGAVEKDQAKVRVLASRGRIGAETGHRHCYIILLRH